MIHSQYQYPNILYVSFLVCHKNRHISDAYFSRIIGEDDLMEDQAEPINNDVLVFGPNGKTIRAKTANQKLMVQSIDKNDILFAIGPAGSGKTYTAVALAVRALKNKSIKLIDIRNEMCTPRTKLIELYYYVS